MKDKLGKLAKIERVRLFVNASDENINIPTRVLSWLSDYANILEAEAAKRLRALEMAMEDVLIGGAHLMVQERAYEIMREDSPAPFKDDGGDVQTYDVKTATRLAQYGAEYAYRHRDWSIEALQDGCEEHVEGWLKQAAPPLETVRSVSDADVHQCLSVWRKSPIHMDAEQTMRTVLEAFLKGGEDHKLSEEGDTP